MFRNACVHFRYHKCALFGRVQNKIIQITSARDIRRTLVKKIRRRNHLSKQMVKTSKYLMKEEEENLGEEEEKEERLSDMSFETMLQVYNNIMIKMGM